MSSAAKQFIEHRGWVRSGLFVLELYCHSKTNTFGLGKIQRAIVDYLATGPGGFGSSRGWPWPGGCVTHGEPCGVPVTSICRAVYGDYLADPTPAQIRGVQRAVRRLEQLKYVHCWHGWHSNVERRYTNFAGVNMVTTRPVSALYVALRWDCEHVDRGRAEAADYRQRQADLRARLDSDPGTALQLLVGGVA